MRFFSILLKNAGKKMCVRLTKSQMDDFDFNYYIWHNQSTLTFQSKFIFALVLTFDLTLFNCSNESELLALNQLNSFLAPTTQDTSDFSETDTTKTDTVSTINDMQQTTTNCYTIPSIYDEELIMGDMAFIEDTEEELTKGKIKHEEDSIPEIIEDTTKTVANENNVFALTDKFEANVYPNPTKNSASFSITILAKENYNIAIYDMQGKLIEAIFEGLIEPQEKIFRFNLNQQKNGIYFIKIVTETQNESLKLVKSN